MWDKFLMFADHWSDVLLDWLGVFSIGSLIIVINLLLLYGVTAPFVFNSFWFNHGAINEQASFAALMFWPSLLGLIAEFLIFIGLWNS